MWAETYRPDLESFRGNAKEVEQVRDWVEAWEPGDGALLLHGPPGVGKTALVHALADAFDMELFESNASDARTRKAVEDKLLQAVQQRSFTGKRKLVLVDEVDGLGSADRGGKTVITEVIKRSKFPVILTANDPYASGMRTIRDRCETVKLGNVHTNSVAARLREICELEGVSYEDGAMKAIARRADGDLRSAINDLESLALDGQVSAEDVKKLDYRETGRDIFEALKIVFKTTTASTASDATQGLSENYDDVLQWIRENVPREYSRGGDVASAFDWLSRADVFRGRMLSRQDWGLLKYVYAFMTVGVALSKEEKYDGWTKYAYPSRIRRMGQSRAARAKRDSIGEKLGDELHISVSEASDLLPFLQLLFGNEAWKENIVQTLGLDEKEVAYIESF